MIGAASAYRFQQTHASLLLNALDGFKTAAVASVGWNGLVRLQGESLKKDVKVLVASVDDERAMEPKAAPSTNDLLHQSVPNRVGRSHTAAGRGRGDYDARGVEKESHIKCMRVCSSEESAAKAEAVAGRERLEISDNQVG